MPKVSDETCTPAITVVDDAKSSVTITSESELEVVVPQEKSQDAVVESEDCPGAHTGNGCE